MPLHGAAPPPALFQGRLLLGKTAARSASRRLRASTACTPAFLSCHLRPALPRVQKPVHAASTPCRLFALSPAPSRRQLPGPPCLPRQVEEEPDGEPMPCHCGARSCTGRMN